MADGFVHTVYKGRKWVNEIGGGDLFGGSAETKEAAVSPGRAEAPDDATFGRSTNRQRWRDDTA